MEWSERTPSEPGWYWFQGNVRAPGSEKSNKVWAYGVVRMGADRTVTFVSSQGKWHVAQLNGLWGQGEAPSHQEVADVDSKSDDELVVVLAQTARRKLDDLGGTIILGEAHNVLHQPANHGDEPSDFIE